MQVNSMTATSTARRLLLPLVGKRMQAITGSDKEPG